MDLSVDEFIERLLDKNESTEKPSDTVNPEKQDIELPEWFDEEQFNNGRRFYWDYSYMFGTSMLLGLVAVLSVPSILRVLVGSRRSSSIYTAYKRYLSTKLHVVSWFEHELKPGTTSWRSLYAVRSRHFRASMAASLHGKGIVSQRDLALTQFGFIGFSMLKPSKFGIRQLRKGDWESYNHFWRVIGHMIGLEDRYNLCRKTVEETLEVCQIVQERVFTPCLENVPEYFEHMARVLLDGMWSVNPTINVSATIYWCKYLADVPGYIYTEQDRIDLRKKLRQHLKGKPLDTGVETTSLIQKPAVEGLPDVPPRLLYLHDFDDLQSIPVYEKLTLWEKHKLNVNVVIASLYDTYLGRLYFNLNYIIVLFLMKYFPFLAFLRFGIKQSMVNIFVEDPADSTEPKPNSEYYKPQQCAPWYKSLLSLFW